MFVTQLVHQANTSIQRSTSFVKSVIQPASHAIHLYSVIVASNHSSSMFSYQLALVFAKLTTTGIQLELPNISAVSAQLVAMSVQIPGFFRANHAKTIVEPFITNAIMEQNALQYALLVHMQSMLTMLATFVTLGALTAQSTQQTAMPARLSVEFRIISISP